MQIIYVHHADRDLSNKTIDSQLQDITENGIIDANLLADKFKNINIKAIYTSPYLRCKHTADIINKYHNTCIINEPRFNEMHIEESWREFSLRNMEAIDDIIKKYTDNDLIICVSSGVNLSAFIYYFNHINPTNNSPRIQAITTSPVLFTTNNQVF